LKRPPEKRDVLAQFMHNRSRPLVLLTLAGIYFAAAKFGFTMAYTADQVTLVWPPTGLSLAALVLLGVDAWPGVFLGALIANVTSHEPALVALGIATGNTFEAVAAAFVVRRVVGTGHSTNWLRYALGLVVGGALVSTTVSATIGVTSLCAGGLQPWAAFRQLWWTWWMGDAASDLLVAPIVLTWTARPRFRNWREAAEAVSLATGLVVVSTLVFARPFASAGPQPLEYVLFPFIIWAAIRFGVAGAAIANVMTSALAIWGTVHGVGPYAIGRGDDQLMLLQIFLGVVGGSGLILGATVSDRDASRKRKAAMLEAALDCVISIDHLGRIVEFNPAAERTFGWARAAVVGKDMARLLIPERLRAAHRAGLQRAALLDSAEALERRLESTAVRADGTEFPIELSLTRLPSDGPPVFTAFLRDITTERKRAHQLTFRATHDGLTKMLNRGAFMERLAVAARQANIGGRSDVAVLFADLDKFKAINDRFGHSTGDRLLMAVARRLRTCVRPTDSIARMGGDEFAVLLERVDEPADIEAVVQRIREELDRPFHVDGHVIRATASVGIATGSQAGPRAEDLIRAADTAMYEVKAAVHQ
jgi:diguanylate cyclase (GGDEF)-like protein/PAS domain S-box-containing protein